MGGTSRMNREVKSGICEGLGCDSPGRLGPVLESRRPTQPSSKGAPATVKQLRRWRSEWLDPNRERSGLDDAIAHGIKLQACRLMNVQFVHHSRLVGFSRSPRSQTLSGACFEMSLASRKHRFGW